MGTTHRPFAKNLLWAFAGRGGVLIAGFGASILLTRLLSPHDVGSYYLILGIALAVSPLANLSLDEPTIRAVAVARGTGKPGHAIAFVKSSLELALLGSFASAIVIIAAWGISRWFDAAGPAHWLELAVLASAWTSIFAIERQFVATLQGMEDIASAATYDRALGRVLACIILLIFWMLTRHPSLTEVLEVYISCEALSLVGAAWSAHRSIKTLGPTDSVVSWKEILVASWPFTVQVVTTAITNQAGIFILALTRSVKEVAIYSIAARLPALLTTSGTIVNVPLAPAIARLHAQNKRPELQSILQAAATVPTVLAVAATIWWAFDGRDLLNVVFGSSYGIGVGVLLILSLNQCVNLYLGPSMLTLSMGGEQSLAMKIGLMGALGQVIAILILVRYWGAEGVAAGVLAATILAKTGGWCAVRWKFGIWSQANIQSIMTLGRQVRILISRANTQSTK